MYGYSETEWATLTLTEQRVVAMGVEKKMADEQIQKLLHWPLVMRDETFKRHMRSLRAKIRRIRKDRHTSLEKADEEQKM